jgi:hypothetical protein
MRTIYIYTTVTPYTRNPDESYASYVDSLDAIHDTQFQKCSEYVRQHFPDESRVCISEFVYDPRFSKFGAFVDELGRHPAPTYYEVHDNDVIVVHDVSRFSRDLAHCTELLDKLSKRNIRVISATEGIDSISCREAFLSAVDDASKE